MLSFVTSILILQEFTPRSEVLAPSQHSSSKGVETFVYLIFTYVPYHLKRHLDFGGVYFTESLLLI
jgi:hypothetical protein